MQQPPIAIAPPVGGAERRHRSSAREGKLYVLLIFVWLRMIDSALLIVLCPPLPMAFKENMILAVSTGAAWTTGLLAAVWFRQDWARCLLAGSLIVTVVLSLSMLPLLRDMANPWKDFYSIIGVTAVYLPIALVLIFSRSIRKLTEGRNKRN